MAMSIRELISIENLKSCSDLVAYHVAARDRKNKTNLIYLNNLLSEPINYYCTQTREPMKTKIFHF